MVAGGLSEVVLVERLFRECVMCAGGCYRCRGVGMSKSRLECHMSFFLIP